MFRPRVIPVLLLKNLGLVKSIKFKNHRYIGDPINAVKIFNDKKADELVFLDISATKEKRLIPLEFVHKVGDEANMPFAVGGGIRNIEDIRKILNLGAEKVVLNTIACESPEFIKKAADTFGSSTIVVCIDIKKNIFNKYQVVYRNASHKINKDAVEFAQRVEEYGAGEIIVQSVDRDGTYNGYDIELIKNISRAVTIPVIALGGARNYNDFKLAVNDAKASAVAAGSLFVYHGPRRAVLINYPSKNEMREIFE
ncbi:MAG: AglZ/HisF2 family acetamidino modification protein [Melioribacter sp.]|uniref:AglZ/HisF2 family acetamidino modification protein n=1 Tax=Melioribacter sp. TaxID=2052167 RepID=UPI003BCBBA21